MRFLHRSYLAKPATYGTTMLYLTGAIAVLVILAFGLSSQNIRETHHVLRCYDRARIEWLLRGAILQAKTTVATPKEWRFQSGIVTLHPPAREETSASLIEVIAPPMNPRERARVQVFPAHR
ncbi:MAG: hypothetical protein N2Z21_10525 [Candidatus Sumerlaeaceae bacterium]|nr:hypothetical protein [Candidatus Sumerlaeaceae bacterium]